LNTHADGNKFFIQELTIKSTLIKDDRNENLFISELTIKQVAFIQEVKKVANYNMKQKKSRLSPSF
jgi:hypothetical protein